METVCGDGQKDDGEACDDGNTDPGDGCSSTCEIEAGWDCSGDACMPICGDGRRVGDEACDDGDTDAGDGCSPVCEVEAGWDCSGAACVTVCGDGIVVGDEACDDNGTEGGDGCSATCTVEAGWDCSGGTCAPVCGDGVAVGSEACDVSDLGGMTCADFGGNVGTLACDDTCHFDATTCALVEICDNGADDDGNGGIDCDDAACAEDPWCNRCGDDRRTGDEACDGLDLAGATCASIGFLDGTLLCDDACGFDTSGCRAAVCGDGTREGTELCDGMDLGGKTCADMPGFATGTLGCATGCTFDTTLCVPPEICSNGLDDDQNGLTDCDDPACTSDVNACPICGDGILSAAEECEDSNTADGDGCSSTCQLERVVCDPNMINLNTDAVFTGTGFTYSADSTGLGNHFSATCRPYNTEDLTMAFHVATRSRIDFSLLGGPNVDSILAVRTSCAAPATERICMDQPAAGSPELASLDDVPAGTMLYIVADRFDDGGVYPGGPFDLVATIRPIVGAGEACDASVVCAPDSFCDGGICVQSTCGDGVITGSENCETDSSVDPTCVDCVRLGASCSHPFDLAAFQTSSSHWTWNGTTAGRANSYWNLCDPSPYGEGNDVTAAFVAPFTGLYTFSMSSGGTPFLQIFEGPCTSDRPAGMACVKGVSTTRLLQAGETYYLVADDWYSGSGNSFTVNVDLGGYCGNGVVDSFERCDGTPGCSADCTSFGTCGDGILDAGEDCDDGNPAGNTGCARDCTVTAGWTCQGTTCTTNCGDGVVVGPEECDDPADPNCVGCRVPGRSCALPFDLNALEKSPGVWEWSGTTAGETDSWGRCAGYTPTSPDQTAAFVPPVSGTYIFDMTSGHDDFFQVHEGACGGTMQELACVDTGATPLLLSAGRTYFVTADGYGSSNSGTFTVSARLVSHCGDGYVSAGERCDGGPDCDATCTMLGTCGDGVVDFGEDCDDANFDAIDGCGLDCMFSPGFDCSTGVCLPICGDGLVVGTEECDDPADAACVNCGILGRSCRSPFDLNALERVPGSWKWTGDTTGKANGYGSCGGYSPTSPDQTAVFIPPATGIYVVDMTSSHDDFFQVHKGACDGSPMQELACTDTGTSSIPMVAGETYFITADGWSDYNWGTFTVTVDLVPVCGDGFVSVGERCDGEPDCDSTCQFLGTCGDGNLDPFEDCDDANTNPNDGCGLDCHFLQGFDCSTGTCEAICGDGLVVADEQCDDAADPACVNCGYVGDGCRSPFLFSATSPGIWSWSGTTTGQNSFYSTCGGDSPSSPDRTAAFVAPVSGDYVFRMVANFDEYLEIRTGACSGTQQAIVCSDSSTVSVSLTGGETYFVTADGWSSYNWGDFTVEIRQIPVCGDSFVGAGERCDGEPDCSADCQMLGSCGDGILDPGEACDDGYISDGCAADCTINPGFDCTSGACETICGDGLVVGTEECDDPSDLACVNCGYVGKSCRSPVDFTSMADQPGIWTWRGSLAGQSNTYPNLCGGAYGADGQDVTGSFVPPVTGTYTFSMTSTGDNYLQLFEGPCQTTATGIACVDSPPFTAQLQAGKTYFVVADDYSAWNVDPSFKVTAQLTPVCGDGYRSVTERCDGEPDCSADCLTLGSCGDGVVDPGEECEDGNSRVNDGCGVDCMFEPGWDCSSGTCEPACGDGLVVGDEECDDPADPDCVSCGYLGRSCRSPYDLNSMAVGSGIWQWTGTTAGQANHDDNLCGGSYGAAGGDLTGVFVPPTTGFYSFDMDSLHDDYLQVYTGTCWGSWQGLQCEDYPPFSLFLTGGQPYYVVADGYFGYSSGPFTVRITQGP